jgi:3-oxoacyl-[acyl-carrier-protein] synthase-3
MYNVQIIGTGSYAPKNIVSNKFLATFVDTSDEWISGRTGINKRRISIDENTAELAIKASINAIEEAKITAEEIDLIIVATATPDYFFPSTACIVQREIGAKNATCFDLSAACTGFIYGLNVATQFIKSGQSKTTLVIGAETLSRSLDWKDRNTCVLFGDGAGAAVLTRGKKGIISIYTGADGNGAEFLEYEAPPLKNTFTKDSEKSNNYLKMQGGEVFKFAVKIIIECIKKVLEDANYTMDEIKYIVPHQANIKIIESSAKKLGINKEKFFMNIGEYGNTSAASIPLALDEMNKKGLLQDGDKIITVGFGGGLTYGAVLLEWKK